MTDALPPRPAYKPSGVPWLGDVPAHWEVRRLDTPAALPPNVAGLGRAYGPEGCNRCASAIGPTNATPSRCPYSRRAASTPSCSARCPHAADAWHDPAAVKVGRKIGSARCFHKPQPPRALEETGANVLALARESDGLLGEILGEGE